MTTHLRPTTLSISRALNTFHRLYSYAPPIYSNVWYQILLRTLPTNARFPWNHTQSTPNIECTYPNCQHPETYQHVLFSCPTISPIWQFHRQVWHTIGCSITWESICHPEMFQVPHPLRPHTKLLRRLWFCLVATILHTLWTARLATRNDNNPPPHIPYLITGTLDLWATSIRSWIRQTIPQKRHRILTTVRLLSEHPSYQEHWNSRPLLMDIG